MNFTFNFTKGQLNTMIPGNHDVDQWFYALEKTLPIWNINTPARVAGFISQVAHESGNFMIVEENLNYSSSRLDEIFPKYFRNAGRDASEYSGKPEKIANVVYANRMGNGDEASGDGWKYRGRGLIQLTGKYNYAAFAKVMGMSLDEVIEYMQTKKGSVDSAAWFWDSRNLNQEADEHDVRSMTRLINGGYNGLKDREQKWKKALIIFSDGNNSEAVRWTTVKLGSRGDSVRTVQKILGITADGIFGPGTERALREWQARNNLKPDGIAGPQTLKALLG